jgi:hypothetical protein
MSLQHLLGRKHALLCLCAVPRRLSILLDASMSRPAIVLMLLNDSNSRPFEAFRTSTAGDLYRLKS